MSPREQLLSELQHVPDAMIEEILNFCLFIKQRQQLKVDHPPSTAPRKSGILTLLDEVEALQANVPPEEWDNLPHDGSINHDHYLYDAPKIEE